MSVARFIADQRTFYRVPYAVCCVILGVSQSWFYKWFNRPATAGQRRRGQLDAEVLKMFNASKRSYGSPRVHADLLEAGWTVSVNTVADSMRRQGLQGRKPKHSKGLTRQDRKAPKFPDLLKRDFTAPGPNVKWCGDITEIPTDEGKLYQGYSSDRTYAGQEALHGRAARGLSMVGGWPRLPGGEGGVCFGWGSATKSR